MDPINYSATPRDINALAALIATELGGDDGGHLTPEGINLVLDSVFNRQRVAPHTFYGSTDNNTLANVALSTNTSEDTGKLVSQYSGMLPAGKLLYKKNKDMSDEKFNQLLDKITHPSMAYYRTDPDKYRQFVIDYINARFDPERLKTLGNVGLSPYGNVINYVNTDAEDAGQTKKWKNDPNLKHVGSVGDHQVFTHVDHSTGHAYKYVYDDKGNKIVIDTDAKGKPIYKQEKVLMPEFLVGTIGREGELSGDGIGVGAGAGVTDYDSAAREVYLRDMVNQDASYTPELEVPPMQGPRLPWSDPRGSGPDNWEVPSELPFSSFFGSNPRATQVVPAKIAPTMTPTKQENRGIMDAIKRGGRQIGRQMRGALGYADGTTGVDPYLNNAIFGSQWGSQHDAMLENSIEGFRKRFPQATNEQVIASISPSILKDIDAQVGHMNMNPSSQFSGRPPASQKIDVPPIRNINSGPQSDTVPAMLTPGEAVIPREVAQDPEFMNEIKEMIDLGRERQNRQDLEEGIDMALDEVNVKAPVPQQYINDGSDFSLPESKDDTGLWERIKDVWSPESWRESLNEAVNADDKKEEVQPKQPGTPPDYFEMENLLNKQGPKVPWKDPQVGPDTWEVPGYTIEDTEKQNNTINELPKDDLLEQRMLDLDRDELERVVTDAKKYADANAFKFKDVTDWIEKNLGFNKQDLYKTLLYYVGGRLTGGSHAGSLRWAGKAVIEGATARGTAVAKAQATAQGDMLKAMTDEAKQKLKDGYFTRSGSKLINTAVRAQDFTTLNMLLTDTQNPSLYNQMAMMSDLSKRKPYYIKGTNPLNNMIMAPHKEKNAYVWQDPDTGEIREIPMDQVEEYKADIHYDNMFNKYANDFKGYQTEDKLDTKNKNTDYKKLSRHYNTSSASAFRTKIKAISEKYNVSPDRVFSMVTRLLEITPDNLEQESLNTDLESAMASLIIDPINLPDNDKLKDFNQEDINKMVEDFGGDPKTVTKHIQTVDTFLAGNPEATPPVPQKLVKDIKNEEVDADIDKAAIDNDIKIKLKALPNPYWKMVYLEFYTSKG